MQNNTRQNEIIDFLVKYHGEKYRSFYSDAIPKHIRYGTIFPVLAKNKVIAVARWNWSDDYSNLRCTEIIIDPAFWNMGILKNIILRVKAAFPCMKTISYKRRKYHREAKIDVDRFLKMGVYNGR